MSHLCHDINSIIRKIKSGDQTAFRALYDATYNHLLRVVSLYTADESSYEDILQEAYFRVAKHVNSADTGRDGYNWLCRIVQNAAYDYYKKNPPLIDPRQNLTYEMMEERLIINCALDSEIKKLPEVDQKLINLRFYKLNTVREIAKELHISKSAVADRIQKLLDELEKKLK